MARFQIDKAGVRNKLEPRREPYWGAPVERGLYVGFRKGESNPGQWIVRARTEDGQRYQSLGTVSPSNDYDAAVRAARAWRKQLDAGVDTSEVETVADACAEYLEMLKQDKREQAAVTSGQIIKRTIDADPLGAIKLSKLREKHIREWMGRLEAGTFTPTAIARARPIRPMSQATIRRVMVVLKAALNAAVKRRYVAAERAIEWQSVSIPKSTEKRRELYLTREQRRAFLEAMRPPLRDVATCVALTGCRPGDPTVCLRKDYDARTGVVRFTTKNHDRKVPLSPDAKALFDRLAKAKLPSAHLFVREDGEPWTSRDWHEQVKAAARAADLPRETVLYTLRHCWITDAIVAGMDLLTVARLVGTSVAMIEANYGHLVEGAARAKLAAINFI